LSLFALYRGAAIDAAPCGSTSPDARQPTNAKLDNVSARTTRIIFFMMFSKGEDWEFIAASD